MRIKLTVSICSLILRVGIAQAQDMSVVGNSQSQVPAGETGSLPQPVQPPTPAPDMMPPAPPQQPPAPPAQTQGQPQPQMQEPAPAVAPGGGQWVYTGEYGWIWMPYGNQYTYEGSANDAYPYSYVYYPSAGWMWLAAPWVWGWGAYPYFGPRGPVGFGWYAGLYRAGYGWGGYRGGGYGGGGRVGSGSYRAAASYRAASGFRGGSGGGSRGGFSGHGGGHR
jgi:hypothetical protein